MGKEKWTMPLTEFTGKPIACIALNQFEARAYCRGAIPTKTIQRSISKQITAEEEARGFKTQGLFRKRVGHFVDGVAVGNRAFVLQQIELLKELGQYKRRKHPIEQMEGLYLSLSAQQETAS